MAKQTKFKTQFDLEARILLEKRHLLAEQRLATFHEKRMIGHWDIANNPAAEVGKQEYHRQKGYDEKKLMHRNPTRAHRIEDIRLPKLKQALAAFKTKTFEFSKDDQSVVIN